jgi:hypothetical protein
VYGRGSLLGMARPRALSIPQRVERAPPRASRLSERDICDDHRRRHACELKRGMQRPSAVNTDNSVIATNVLRPGRLVRFHCLQFAHVPNAAPLQPWLAKDRVQPPGGFTVLRKHLSLRRLACGGLVALVANFTIDTAFAQDNETPLKFASYLQS